MHANADQGVWLCTGGEIVSVSSHTDEIEVCLRGEKLYGDDFTLEEVEVWFRDEEEGYYQLGAKDRATYRYPYHALDWLHGFSFLTQNSYQHILGIGSAYGEELRPVAAKARRITILEPSSGFAVTEIGGTPAEYVKPRPDGKFPFVNETFDLITCLSVLHHIPNVSAVVREAYRCLRPGGIVLLREPVVSMGDWRMPRKGLTKRERGIPLPILRDMLSRAGFQVLRERLCAFPLTRRLNYVLRFPVFNSVFWTKVDALICHLPVWPTHYHPKRTIHKLRPSAVFFVLKRPSRHRNEGTEQFWVDLASHQMTPQRCSPQSKHHQGGIS